MKRKSTSPSASELRDMGAEPTIRPMMRELYRRAEAQVKKGGKKIKAVEAKSVADPERLLHELQVHQVELEMQNDELLKVRNEMEVALEKCTDLYDFAPVSYFSLDEQGRINEVNLTGAALLGVERSRLINQPLLRFVATASQPGCRTFLKQILSKAGKHSADMLLIKEGVGEFWTRWVGVSSVTASAPKKCCRVAISDISLSKQAEEAQNRLATIVEFSDDAIIGKNLHSIISSWNKGAEHIFGYTADEIVGTSITRLIPADRRDEENQILTKIKRGQSVQHFETLRRTKGGRLINVSITASPIKNLAGKIVGVSKVARNISERKKIEEGLRESEERFRVMANAMPQLAWTARPDGHVFWYNQRWYDYTGKTAKQLEGWGWQSVHDKAVLPKVMARWKNSLATRKPFEMTFPLRGANGSFRPFLTRVVPLKNAAGHVVQWLGTNTDIDQIKREEAVQRRIESLSVSNRKLEQEIATRLAKEKALRESDAHKSKSLAQSRLMQEQLRDLSRRILHCQEEERKRISRELHDVIAQTLTGISIRLAALKNEASLDTEDFDRSITHTQQLVEKSVNIVHLFARDLRPAVLDDLGLISALHSYMKNYTAETGVRTHLTAAAQVEQLDTARRTVLYRVAQEALANVSRHAKASEAHVKIQKVDGVICMEITDNGEGFRRELLASSKKKKRLGLLGMRERVEMVHGNFDIQSAPGKGTTIQVRIPLGKNAGGGDDTPEQINQAR